MANWYGMSRSNYFKVKDEAAFRASMIDVGVGVETNKDGLFAVFGNDEGYWPSENEEAEELDFVAIVQRHLADGEIAVFITVGHEKARYGMGYAIAFDNTGDSEELNLTHIYELVFKKWGKRPTVAEY